MAEYRGRFLWHELMTDDVEGAKAFYGAVVGWDPQPFGDGDMPYTVFNWDGQGMGGLMVLPEEARKQGAPPHWAAYVGTPDVDATTARANELGGATVVPPTDIPGIGRFSVLQDPQGAVLSAFRPDQVPERADEEPGVGDFSWHELLTTDPDAALRFYTALHGWTRGEVMDLGPEVGTYHLFSAGPREVGGVFQKPADLPAPPHWLFYIRVADLEGALARCQEQGGQVLNGPQEVPGGDRVAQCQDPQGVPFALHVKA